MRLFAAIALAPSTRARIAMLQYGLPEARRVPPENFHVTLAYFGETDAAAAEDLNAALGAVRFEPFELTFIGADVFGGDKARLIYAAIAPNPALEALHHAVATAARAAAIHMDARRFRPHVTLARMGGRRLDARTRAAIADAASFHHGPEAVDAFTLFRSHLGAGPPYYEPLAIYPAIR